MNEIDQATSHARAHAASVVVTEDDAGERADVVLGRRIPGLSRRVARSLALEGKLRVDGQRRPPSTRVEAGARLELALAPPAETAPAPALLETLAAVVDAPLALTADFIYVHKPAGVHSVALTPAQPGVLATAVAQRWPECAAASPDPREAGAVHRLDRPTSGVLAFARSEAAWSRAREAFSDERVAKHYLAVSRVLGAPEWPPPLPPEGLQGWIEPAPDESEQALASPLAAALGELLARGASQPLDRPPIRVRAPLGRGPSAHTSAVRLDGRRARTVVCPLATTGQHELLRLRLETGRRHQARVHLAWIGRPILGDRLYGPGTVFAHTRAGAASGPEMGEAAHAIALHAFAIDLSAAFPDEAPVLAPPISNFWPPPETPSPNRSC
ncbi:hypothetical protein G6O69_23545 [Pseudenhygromyxa sp. WMMC2535]|uniref:pseudouridine synthase n=1 Tax=Pseudenhygromyxa sp. WMMC2535 TaxID=2712867 RepID=UPI0015520E2D|nr:pseudouridine synthase [Pseudenhygromyxa sp. WMMC2535]NVB40834.1 hypothetical protein [Pseudenhygromyxa sp. WMMC2535]